MYICICHGVTDRDIQCCVEDGARSLRELRECLGVGTQCGKCAREVRTILKEARSGAMPGALANEAIAA